MNIEPTWNGTIEAKEDCPDWPYSSKAMLKREAELEYEGYLKFRRKPNCEKMTLHVGHVHVPNNVLHLLLSVVTLGLWMPMWVIILAVNPFEKWPYQCQVCGFWTKFRGLPR